MIDHLPADSKARKLLPVATGVVDYFPDALVAVAELSRIGNDKHNPGEPLRWARGKGGNNSDELMRHFIDRGKIDPDDKVRHSTKVAWRALAILQLEIEAARISHAPKVEPGSTAEPEPEPEPERSAPRHPRCRNCGAPLQSDAHACQSCTPATLTTLADAALQELEKRTNPVKACGTCGAKWVIGGRERPARCADGPGPCRWNEYAAP